MIASEDVRRVIFDRTMRGYRCEDVDDYLKQVADSMDALAADNAELQKKLVVLAQRIDQYRADEDTLRTTMINAQRLGENIIKEAKQKAAETIRNATIKAEDREQRARDEVELCKQELVTIRREADSFKRSLMDMYRQHIELLSKLPSYTEPEPEPEEPAEPEEEPAQAAAPAPAPAEAPEFEQQEFGDEGGESYFAAEAEDEPVVDTVEFDLPPEPAPERFAPGAGLYETDTAPAPKPRGKKPRRGSAGDDLPEGMESFAGVDFDS